jgi:hypothetical protein
LLGALALALASLERFPPLPPRSLAMGTSSSSSAARERAPATTSRLGCVVLVRMLPGEGPPAPPALVEFVVAASHLIAAEQ